MPNHQLHSSQENNLAPLLEFKGEFLLINGKEAPYEKQMIRNNSFFIVDLGLDLPLEEEIKIFDQKYFNYLLNKQIIKELELHHPSIGLKILQAMLNLAQKNYVAIFWRLSLVKIKKIIMNDCFFIHIIKKMIDFMPPERKKKLGSQSFIRENALLNLDSSYKRLLYILDEVHCSQALRQTFYMIAYEVVMEVITSANFQSILSKGLFMMEKPIKNSILEKEKQPIDTKFLSNTIKLLQTLTSLTKMPQQIIELCNIKNERILMKTVLNSKLMHIFTVNFQYFFNFDRHNLSKLLAIVAVQNQQQLWHEIIAKKYEKQSKSMDDKQPFIIKQTKAPAAYEKILPREMPKSKNIQKLIGYEETTNENLFFLLITSNFYEIQQPDWELSQTILQCIIKHNVLPAKYMLLKLFAQLTSHFMTASIIELVIKFLHKICKTPQFDRNHLRMFLIDFMGSINCAIDSQYAKTQAKQQNAKNCSNSPKKMENLFLQNAFLKIYSILLELKLINLLSGLQIRDSVTQLMQITRNRKGVIQGARRAFIRSRDVYILDLKLKLRFGKKTGIPAFTQSLSRNCRNQIEELTAFLKSIE